MVNKELVKAVIKEAYASLYKKLFNECDLVKGLSETRPFIFYICYRNCSPLKASNLLTAPKVLKAPKSPLFTINHD